MILHSTDVQYNINDNITQFQSYSTQFHYYAIMLMKKLFKKVD